ncbi:hypothetical protein H7X87_02360 [Acetobacteraceae bacterium]|nr:hypothetical protein [Candidatus Parcubacteria bacterium]
MAISGNDSSSEVTSGTTTTDENGNTSQTSSNTTSNTAGNLSGATGAATVSAATQAAGMQVMVSLSKVNEPTWIIVYDNVNGAPTWILGAGLVFPESPKEVAIDLLRPTTAGQTYLIAQGSDVNDDHIYTQGVDMAMRDSGDKVITTSFRTR